MRKLLSTLAIAAVFAPAANATTARILALGNQEIDVEGSYYIEDNRNIFLNVANMHDFADQVIIEWGKNGKVNSGDSATNNTVVTDYAPKAQGGMLKKHGNFVYGVYLGNESNTSSMLRILGSSQAAIVAGAATNSSATSPHLLDTTDNQLDLFFGWEAAGLKWGTGFLYSKDENKGTQKEEDKAMAARFGVKASNWDAHVNLSLASTSKETVAFTGALSGLGSFDHEFDGKFGIHAGGSYHMGKNTLWGYVKHFSWEQKDSFDWATKGATVNSASAGSSARAKTGTSEGEFTTIQVGWGAKHEVGEGTLFTSVHLDKKDIELTLASKAEVSVTKIPLVLGYEAKATEWLTLRGSVTQNLYGKSDNKNLSKLNAAAENLAKATFGGEGKTTIANSTDVRAGATLTFGKLAVDGLIGATNTNSATTEAGTLRLDELMYRVGMTYKF
ncbi:hypothetical protein M899_1324 [Bacteriovorax sp. BSW11_IV]|uniref:hypothetical protein n=1 Tax=Bacteriovorax sp. BSW11_IV TaxID=1353529 RepID=UPI00038A3DAD|nr:hypothetical protein [Bacteriovorax sp. BSW11_IV]EQC45888.1 hypothetical protein M899_1324 [Bacteriovorax sp. BSW11_IV]